MRPIGTRSTTSVPPVGTSCMPSEPSNSADTSVRTTVGLRDQVADTWTLLDHPREALDELEQIYVGSPKRPRSKNGGKPAAQTSAEA